MGLNLCMQSSYSVIFVFTLANVLHIDFPAPDFRYREESGARQIWDAVRRQWVSLSPEEWVRQNFIQYLTQRKQYPPALMSVEKEIVLGELKKRCDLVLYRDAQPWMIVECKEMNVALSDKVLMQLLRYNISVPVPYLVITNGKETYGWARRDGQMIPLVQIPDWSEV